MGGFWDFVISPLLKTSKNDCENCLICINKEKWRAAVQFSTLIFLLVNAQFLYENFRCVLVAEEIGYKAANAAEKVPV